MDEETNRYEMGDKRNWPEKFVMMDEIKSLKNKNEILEEKFKFLVDGINRSNETIDRLSQEHYHIAKDNERQLKYILEEIRSINIFVKSLRKENE